MRRHLPWNPISPAMRAAVRLPYEVAEPDHRPKPRSLNKRCPHRFTSVARRTTKQRFRWGRVDILAAGNTATPTPNQRDTWIDSAQSPGGKRVRGKNTFFSFRLKWRGGHRPTNVTYPEGSCDHDNARTMVYWTIPTAPTARIASCIRCVKMVEARTVRHCDCEFRAVKEQPKHFLSTGRQAAAGRPIALDST